MWEGKGWKGLVMEGKIRRGKKGWREKGEWEGEWDRYNMEKKGKVMGPGGR